MIASVHNLFVGHFGLERTLKRLKEVDETWDFQRQHVRHFIDRCTCCQKISILKIPIHVHTMTKIYPLSRKGPTKSMFKHSIGC